MRTLGNILWHFPFLGFIVAFNTFITGCLLLITIVGIPLGLGLIQFAKFLLLPFSSEMISDSKLHPDKSFIWRFFQGIVYVLYLPFGIIISVFLFFQTIGLFISIVGIPQALVLLKSLPTIFNPVGKVCVSRAVAQRVT